MKTYKFFFNVDKEEKWLNDQARQGRVLKNKTFGGYEFEQADHSQAVIRIDYRIFKTNADFEDYRVLFEDSGWTHISGTKRSGPQYFVTQSADPSMDIFSDVDSKAGRYKRLAEMWLMFAVCYLPLFIIMIATDRIDPFAFLHPKALYYTPGLWEMAGAQFWKAFLFETPFVLMRGVFLTIIAGTAVCSLIFYVKANRQYEKSKLT